MSGPKDTVIPFPSTHEDHLESISTSWTIEKKDDLDLEPHAIIMQFGRLSGHYIAPIRYMIPPRVKDYKLASQFLPTGLLSIDRVKPKSKSLTGEIIEVCEDYVIVDLLLDEKDMIFQKRKIELELIETIINIKVGTLVNIEIETSPGQRRFIYTPGSRMESPKEKPMKSFYEEFKESSFFTPLNTSDEDKF